MTETMADAGFAGQAEAMKSARLRLRLTQQAVADRSGVSAKTVRRAEAGREVSAENLLSMFAALGLDAAAVPVPPRRGEGAGPAAETERDTPPAGGIPWRLWLPLACGATGLAFGDAVLVAASVAFSASMECLTALFRRIGVDARLAERLKAKPAPTRAWIAAAAAAFAAILLFVYLQGWMFGRMARHVAGAFL